MQLRGILVELTDYLVQTEKLQNSKRILKRREKEHTSGQSWSRS